MRKVYLPLFILAGIFLVAAVISLVGGNGPRAVVALIAAVSFCLSGLHYRRRK